MSVAEMEPQEQKHEGGGHHETPEKVDGRERLGIWLFIGADIITVAALLFTYLYLRGVDTNNHWMMLQGYKGSLHTYQDWENLLNNGQHRQSQGHLRRAVVGRVAVAGDSDHDCECRGALAGRKGPARDEEREGLFTDGVWWRWSSPSRASPSRRCSSSDIPQVFVAVNDSITMSYTTYDSAIMAIIASTLGHLVILAFLGLGLAIRSARGVISGDRWYQVRLVRYFWVWVAISSIVVTLITTTINTVH